MGFPLGLTCSMIYCSDSALTASKWGFSRTSSFRNDLNMSGMSTVTMVLSKGSEAILFFWVWYGEKMVGRFAACKEDCIERCCFAEIVVWRSVACREYKNKKQTLDIQFIKYINSHCLVPFSSVEWHMSNQAQPGLPTASHLKWTSILHGGIVVMSYSVTKRVSSST